MTESAADSPAAADDAAPLPEPSVSFASYLHLARGFWMGRTRGVAWTLTLVLLGIVLGNLAVQVLINLWNARFFNAVEARDGDALVAAIWAFVPLAVAFAFVAVAMLLLRSRLQVRWREWFTGYLIDRWLSERHYYQLSIVRADLDAPEFRIDDDVRLATELIVDFAIGLLSALLGAVAFAGVLWNVGGSLTLTLAGHTLTIPGYLVIAVVAYSLFASLLVILIGRPLIERIEAKNREEAGMRFELTRIRESAEAIALIGGEADERMGLGERLRTLVSAWVSVFWHQSRVEWIKAGNGILLSVVPVMLCLPKYLAGELTLGMVMQLSAAFIAVQTALNWLVENFPRVAEWRASANRVLVLDAAFRRLEETLDGEGHAGIQVREGEDDSLHLVSVSVRTDDGDTVIDAAEAIIKKGERILLMGDSGSGKSTLIRAIAGLWPWGEGDVVLPRGGRVMFMPQHPYVPLGTLKAAVLYPQADTEAPDEAVIEALKTCGLKHLVPELAVEDRWDKRLSGGELQRLAFARALVARPNVLVMDEATAALDVDGQERVLLAVIAGLGDATMISIGHRPELEEFHTRKLVLKKRPLGSHLHSETLPDAPTRKGLLRRLLQRRKDAPKT